MSLRKQCVNKLFELGAFMHLNLIDFQYWYVKAKNILRVCALKILFIVL